jgi:hypothetical protein
MAMLLAGIAYEKDRRVAAAVPSNRTSRKPVSASHLALSGPNVYQGLMLSPPPYSSSKKNSNIAHSPKQHPC